MEVREATAADVTAVTRVAERSWTTDYPDILSRETAAAAAQDWYGEDRIASELDRDDALLLVADRDPAGVAGFAHAIENDGVGNILRIYVDPDHRGEGVGTALVEATERRLFDRGVDRVRAMVLADNDPGNEFYRAQGFRRLDEVFETRVGDDRYAEHVWVDDAAQ